MACIIGRQDALVALMMVLCKNAQFFGFASWENLTFANTVVNNEDSNYVARVLRGAANSQTQKMALLSLHREGKEGFRDGILPNLHSTNLAPQKPVFGPQPLNAVFPVLALPTTYEATLQIVDNNLPGEIFHLPSDLEITFSLRHLTLQNSHPSTTSLCAFLAHCRKLETFALTFVLLPGYDNTSAAFNHLHILATFA